MNLFCEFLFNSPKQLANKKFKIKFKIIFLNYLLFILFENYYYK